MFKRMGGKTTEGDNDGDENSDLRCLFGGGCTAGMINDWRNKEEKRKKQLSLVFLEQKDRLHTPTERSSQSASKCIQLL